MIRKDYLLLVLFLCFSISLNAQTTPEVVTPISTIKTIQSENPARFSNPSDPGIPAGDLNGDGNFDFIQNWETWTDLRSGSEIFHTVTTFLSYSTDGELYKSSMVDGTYFPVGNLTNSEQSQIATINVAGNVEIYPVSSSDSEDFIIGERTQEITGTQRYYSAAISIPALFDSDEYPDVLICENDEFNFDECMIIFGNQEDAESLEYHEFSFADFEIEFITAPRIFSDESLSGSGNSIYIMGEALPSYASMMYEFQLNEEREMELVFSHEWVLTSGEPLANRRYYIEDFDGDNELEILSSDDRLFPIKGLQQIYFSDPVCDIRDIDYSGDSLHVRNPEIISTNCLVDRVVLVDTSGNDGAAKITTESDTDAPVIFIWQEGDYSHCSGENVVESCSSPISIVADQTILPCSYNSCNNSEWYLPGSSYPYSHYSGYADPENATRGMYAWDYSISTGGVSLVEFNSPFEVQTFTEEIERMAEIERIELMEAAWGESFIPVLETNHKSGFGTSSQYHGCSEYGSSCEEQVYIQFAYYELEIVDDEDLVEESVDSENRKLGGDEETYHHHEVVKISPKSSGGVDPGSGFKITFSEPMDELTESDKLIINNQGKSKIANDVPVDTIEVLGTINLEPMGQIDNSSGEFTIKNIGNIDGIEGDELLVGSNYTQNGGAQINKAWIYFGTNTTYEKPDLTVSFENDTSIAQFPYIPVGRIAEPVGDVNGDGYNDFALGFVDYDRTTNASGAVLIYSGDDFVNGDIGDTLTTPLITLKPSPTETETIFAFGAQISGGDFDGDGFSDVAVLADQAYGSSDIPTIAVYRGGENMDTEPDYLLYVTPEDVGGFGTTPLTSFVDAVIHFMPKEEGSVHQDLYFSPGATSEYPDAVIFKGSMNEPSTTPDYTLAEPGATPTGSGVNQREKPAVGDMNGDGFYEVYVTKQFDGRDGLLSSRVLVYSPNSDIEIANESEMENPFGYRLSQNYPNPFNPSTNIEFKLGMSNKVTLKIFDVLGRVVAILLNEELFSSGVHTINFDASGLASGVYLFRMEAGGFIQTRKMLLMK
ncbi:MAG TPA: hypothetical protein DEQ34_08560 [Balneolaceae bacterium]|nr:hypothetical protein [Balneolaceae bacterium]